MTRSLKNFTLPATPNRREHLTAFLFSALTTILFLLPFGGKVLFARDLFLYSYSGIGFLKQNLAAGEMPLWNPSLFLGYPFLAEIANAALYPLSLLHLLFSVPAGIMVYLALHYCLTGYLMWRLLRAWALEETASLFGALCWMTSGYLVSMHVNLNYLAPAAWYPGLLLAFHFFLRTPRLSWFLATCLAWAMILLAGDPQAFLFAGVLLFAYALVGLPRQTPFARTTLPLLALAGLVTWLLVLAQFLPSLEFGAWCTKLQGYDFKTAAQWSFHPLRLLEWIWPEIWGVNFSGDKPVWALFMVGEEKVFWAGSVYLGLLPLGLALFHSRHWREKPIGFLVLTFLGFLGLALGSYSPLYRLLWAVFPPYRIFRYPEKHLAVATFALCGLAAFGFHHLFAKPDADRRFFIRLMLGFAAFLGLAFFALFLVAHPLSQTLADFLIRSYQAGFAPAFLRSLLLQAAARALIVALAFGAVFLLAQKLEPVKRRLAWILILLTAADLLTLGRHQVLSADPTLFSFTPSAVSLIRREKSDPSEKFRVFNLTRWSVPKGVFQAGGPNLAEKYARWLRNTLYPNLGMAEGLDELSGYESANLHFITSFLNGPLLIPTLRMLNLKFFLDSVTDPIISDLPELSEVGRDLENNLRVLSVQGTFPRAFLVDGVQPAADPKEFFESLYSTDFSRQAALLQPASGPRPGTMFQPARILVYRPRRVEVETTAPKAGYLVLSDTYFPGWEALVDGAPTRILRANYLVRAVALPPGEHQVVFTYRPWPWRIGKIVSLTSLLLLPGFALLRRPKPAAVLP